MMNLLTFKKDELNQEGLLVVRGERAHRLYARPVAPGRRLRVGALDGGIGYATVLTVDPTEVVLSLEQLEPSKQLPILDLIVALPRPQTFKKVLQLAGTMGINRVMAIRSERVERSYFSSTLLEPERIEEELRIGLEQGITATLPQVSIHSRFRRFVEDELAVPTDSWMVLAHPAAEENLAALVRREPPNPAAPVVLAVGPEGGWNDFEVETFMTRGFRPFQLGSRVLRVEQAVCSLAGQIELIRTLRSLESEASAERGCTSRAA